MSAALRTARLLLRPWRDDDLPTFAALNADPAVREFFPSILTAEQSDAEAAYCRQGTEERGYSFWPVELPGTASFIGIAGLSVLSFPASFTPCVEIGWRFAKPYWGHGYATEAAQAWLDFGFSQLGLPEIVAYTPAINSRSRRVMERLHMTRDAADDFTLPHIDPASPINRFVLYRRGAATRQN